MAFGDRLNDLLSWWFRNPVNSPVEGTGSWTIPWFTLGFSTIPNGGWVFGISSTIHRWLEVPTIHPFAPGFPRGHEVVACICSRLRAWVPWWWLSWDNCQIGGFSEKKTPGKNKKCMLYECKYTYLYIYIKQYIFIVYAEYKCIYIYTE